MNKADKNNLPKKQQKRNPDNHSHGANASSSSEGSMNERDSLLKSDVNAKMKKNK
ncbi:MAG: hypothetical protein JWN76_3540 [Chitinophagaceae bacterium]|nr:hypothetical protein [Chitinophagaceae bacterium]